jgi:hypothetical protein
VTESSTAADPAVERARSLGCLLGGAVGDALGAAVTHDPLAEIHRRFGPAGLRDYAPAHGGLGRLTDHTQMTLFTAEGLIRTMVIGAFMSPVSNLIFAWLATQGHQLSALFVAISVDNLATGIAGTALIAYMSSLTSIGFTATQYALFSSLYALPGKLIASQSGRIVEGSARWADGGGPPALFKGLFTRMPDGSLVEGAAKSGVSVAGLGAGYFTFFIYSAVIGVFAIVLAFYVAKRQPTVMAEQQAREDEALTGPRSS